MMKTIHSYWAYLVLAILIITVANAIYGLLKKKSFSDKDLRLGLFTLIFHISNCLLVWVGIFLVHTTKRLKLMEVKLWEMLHRGFWR